MDNYPPGFNNILPGEEPIPEDWPRCEECTEPLDDSETQHAGKNLLCNDCGTVCDHCDEKVWKDEIKDGTSYHQNVKDLCKYCIDDVAPEEITPCWEDIRNPNITFVNH